MTAAGHGVDMASPPVDRTGTLMVRLWIEPGHATGVRARITQALDADAEPWVAVAGSADDICAIVRTWVEEVTSSSDPDAETIGL